MSQRKNARVVAEKRVRSRMRMLIKHEVAANSGLQPAENPDADTTPSQHITSILVALKMVGIVNNWRTCAPYGVRNSLQFKASQGWADPAAAVFACVRNAGKAFVTRPMLNAVILGP